MTNTERLAPHGGCNWEGCRECFPEQKVKTVDRLTGDQSVMYVVQRRWANQEWEDFSEWSQKEAADTVKDRGRVRTGSAARWRVIQRTRTTTIIDRLV
jgi:hypothetical protein